MTPIVQLLRLVFVALAVVWGASPNTAFAQLPSGSEGQIALLDGAAAELDSVRSSLTATSGAAELDPLRARAQAVSVTANAAAEALEPRLMALQAMIAALGEPTENEADDILDQRATLTRERDELDSAIKRARLLSANTRDTIETVNRAMADLFNRSTLERVASPISSTYWQALASAIDDDLGRLTSFLSTSTDRLVDAMTVRGTAIVSAALAVAAILLFPIRRRLRRVGRHYAAHRAPHTQARRSGLALWFLAVGSLTTSVAFVLAVQGLEWADALTPAASTLAWTLALAASYGSVTVSLGSALLLVGQPSWRLLPIEDHAAEALRPFPFWAACTSVIGTGLIELNRVVGASQAANVTANLLVAVLYVGLLGSVLVALRRLRGARDLEAGEVTQRRSVVTIAMMVGWIAIFACTVAILRGNVNLALFIGREIVWTTFVASGAFLMMTAVDDLATTILSEVSRPGRALVRGFGLRETTVRQGGLLLSAFARLSIAFLALSAIVAPLGGGTGPAYTQLSGISSIAIGGIVIQPGAVVRAGLLITIGLAGVRMLGRWMDDTYLPATELDAGARNSAATIIRYIGFIVVGAWALSSLGIGIERLALLASALSVGIGFGLQAITQNFISGLILLAERPVKIGDTIRVGSDEGDVKCINVRSTEIQIGDRSTLIVPNSELITKSVRNMTLANPLGRVHIAFAIPMEDDADHVAGLLLASFEKHPAILAEPKPSVFIDGLTDGKVNLNGFAFVSSPRTVYATRSEVLFEFLRCMKATGVSTHIATIVDPSAGQET